MNYKTQMPTITRENSGAWHWWVKWLDKIREGLAASKREACNARRIAAADMRREAEESR